MTTGDAWSVAAAVLVALGGGGGIVAALSNWLGKVWAERLMNKDRARYAAELEELRSNLERSNRLVQAELEKTIFVTRVHFETEFEALTNIWRHVACVRAAMSSLRPRAEVVNLLEPKEARLKRRFDTFDEAVGKLVDAVDQRSPFYPKEIYDPVEKLVLIAQRERQDVALGDDAFELDWYSRGKTNFKEFRDGAEVISGLIRQRISQLSVYGSRVGLEHQT